MLNLTLDRPLVVFDIESTGLFPRRDRIVELAAVKVMPDGTETERCWLLNPTIPIPPDASKIHGITDEIVRECPTFADKAEEIFAFFDGCDLGGFNSDRYDVPCLEEEFARVGMNFAVSTRRLVDVMKVFHRKEPRDLTAAVSFYLGRDHAGAHGAEADARATLEVLKAQCGRYADLPKTTAELDAFLAPRDPLNADRSGMLRWRDGELCINFGKKKGAVLRKLLIDEPKFLKWIVNGDFDTDVKTIVRDLLENGRLPAAPKV
jgi:DNA polymerase-3 subunit epsilon